MVTRLPRLLLLPLLAAIAGSVAAQDNDITIYRCTDAGGHLTVQDSPCADDQSQQVRRMIQPADPPPRAEPVAPAALQPAPEPSAPVVVARHEPRPMYECVRDDGSRYTSDDGEGNPRWISSGGWSYYDGPPLRGPGIVFTRGQAASSSPVLLASARATDAGGSNQPWPRFRSADSTPPPPPPPPPGHGHGHDHHRGHGLGYGGGMWVRDECHALPQVEVCDRLRDRREQIRSRRFNAQANERATLGTEERGINARLAEDCGGA
ncbi:DUF4124 domain-containing protein [Luteimonas sp. 22616]|uniref:DUF4124 domain-containing protein n=1 Tax=Luteimonas sp. 22616 TaxID=3453951 RepID=UPI003F872EC5